MSKKKAFALRLSPETWDALEKWAADDFRSVNGQIEWIIHNALKNAGRSKSTSQQSKGNE
ncbi:MAG: Arc family DNA-binding protein [Bacteroidales bacterium]|nr:Arc family DNA-binding protein [Bacteroidales bacterium]